MSVAEAVQTTSKAPSSSSSGFVLKRKCACGGSAGLTGECEECRRKKLLGRAPQRKLAINEPGDEYEREADRVAEQVMRIADPARRSSGDESPASSLVQRRVSGAATTGVGAAPPLVQEVLASPGQQPDASARAFLEPRFGQSLHDVRLHTDGRAQQAAESVHARAFTVGRHIVFGAGEYLPHSITSTLLLAHELTHVIQQTGGASVLARKSSAARGLDEGAVAVAEQVAGDEVESTFDVAGASSRGELSRLSAALPHGQRDEEGEAILVEKPLFPQAEPAGLTELSEIRTTSAEAAGEPSAVTPADGVETGTPSETGWQFNALRPSVQAETYSQLGAALSASLTNQVVETQAAIPELSASLEGVSELPATPVPATPPLTPSVAGQAHASSPEPVVHIPQVPTLPPVSQPTLPTAQAAEPNALEQTLVAIDPAPVIATVLEKPDIPLGGNADPAALGTLESAAADEAARSLGAAQAGVMAVSPETVQPLELDEVVPVPALTGVTLLERTPQIEGMDKLAGYALSPRDRAIVDAQIGPSMHEAATGAQLELDQHEHAFDQERTRLHLEADSDAAGAQARAEEDQRLEVEQGRQDLAAEQERTLAQQQAAVDGALGELAVSQDGSRRQIDDRLAADRATVDEVYTAAEMDARAEVEKGHAAADAAMRATVDQVQASSWWDWAIDTWQGFVQWFAANLVAIWEGVNQTVAGLFDRAIQLATEVVNGAVAFVKRAISAYYDLWIRLVDKLLGNIFPELAAAFRAAVEGLKARIFEALDIVAAAYLQTLRVVADALVAGLNAGVQAYKAGVAAYLAIWEAIQNGEWAEIGRTVLTAILTAVGIDPAEFFGTFNKIDEVIDDVIADPGVVGRNAVAALGLGFKQFGTNFIGNFTAAFVEWITGAAAIVLPKTFSLAGIFDVVCQVLNLTRAYLRKKAVQHLGEGAVTAVEELTEAAWAFVAGGWAGLWNLVKDKLTTLVDDVVVAMGTWLVEKAILVVGRWIAGLAATMGVSLIFEALIALWQFVMWLKDQFHRFWMIVKSTVDSVHDFVKGKIEPAANKIEGTLQDLIVPAIDLVAKLLNISNIAKKVEHIIEAVRGLIDSAVDSVIAWLKKKIRAGVQRVKEGATRLFEWWNIKKEFRGKDGERHSLFFEGSRQRPRLIVQSDKTDLESWIEKAKAANTIEGLGSFVEKYDYLQTAIASVEMQYTEGDVDEQRQVAADFVTDSEFKEGIDQLIVAIPQQFFGGEAQKLPPSILTFKMVDGKPTIVLARPLTKLEGNTRGEPSTSGPVTEDPLSQAVATVLTTRGMEIRRALEDIDPASDTYRQLKSERLLFPQFNRVHLISSELHGPARRWNFVLAGNGVNGPLRIIEERAKRFIAPSVEKTPGILRYETTVTYHSSNPESAIRIEDFPASVSVRVKWVSWNDAGTQLVDSEKPQTDGNHHIDGELFKGLEIKKIPAPSGQLDWTAITDALMARIDRTEANSPWSGSMGWPAFSRHHLKIENLLDLMEAPQRNNLEAHFNQKQWYKLGDRPKRVLRYLWTMCADRTTRIADFDPEPLQRISTVWTDYIYDPGGELRRQRLVDIISDEGTETFEFRLTPEAERLVRLLDEP